MVAPTATELEAAQGAYALLAGGLVTLFLVGLLAARRLGGGVSPWAWGGVTFVLSQAARLPVLTIINALVIGGVAPVTGSGTWFVAIAIASVTAGVFEEGSRALILSTAAKRIRSERGGASFGLGHAGIEALIFTLVPSVAALLLLSGIADGSAYVNLPAASLVQLDAAITFLGRQEIGSSLLALSERIFATLLHVILTLYVLRAVAEQGDRTTLVRRLLFPAALHAAANFTTVALLPVAGIVAAEVVFAAITIGALLHYRRTRAAASLPLS